MGALEAWDAVPAAAAPAQGALEAWDAAPSTAPADKSKEGRSEWAKGVATLPQTAQNTLGAAEAAAHAATGAFGRFAGGAAALGTTLGGMIRRGEWIPSEQTAAEALRDAHNVASQLTYEPQTETGQAITGTMGSLLDKPVVPAEWLPNVPNINPRPDLARLGGAILPAVAPAVPAVLRAGRAALGTETAAADVAGGVPRGAAPGQPAARIEPTWDASTPAGVSGQPGTAGATGAGSASPFLPGSVGSAQVGKVPPAASIPSQVREGFFPAHKPSTVGEDMSPDMQAARRAVVNAIGGDEIGIRDGTITGNPKTQANEHILSQVDSPAGNVMQAQVASEQQALRNYGQQVIDMAGGSPDIAPASRGAAIIAPLKSLDDWFNQRASSLYDAARAKAGDVGGIQSDSLDALLNDKDFRATLAGQNKLPLLDTIDGQVQRFKTEGWGNDAGPNSVASAERFRQWLNATTDSSNAPIMARVKEALDNDVAAAGGADVFKDARAMWSDYKQTLSDPKGISSLLAEEGPNSINRKIALNDVPQRIATMQDTAQFQHIVDTLNRIPSMPGISPAVADSARQAVAEIRGQIAENVVNSAARNQEWSPIQYNKTATANLQRMLKVFSPEELAAFRTLNDAGYILQARKAYPGAGVQAENMLRRGISNALPRAGAAAGAGLGGFIGGPMGAAGGAAAGGLAGARMSSLLDARLEATRAEQLSSRLRANAQGAP